MMMASKQLRESLYHLINLKYQARFLPDTTDDPTPKKSDESNDNNF
jgi:hypothetical protein